MYVSTNEVVALWTSRVWSPWITALFNVWAFQGPICAATSSLLCGRCTCANKCIAWQKWGPPSSTHLWHWIYLCYSFLTLGTDYLWCKILKQKYLWYENKDPLEPICISLCDTTTSQQHKLLQALRAESAVTWGERETVTRKAKA